MRILTIFASTAALVTSVNAAPDALTSLVAKAKTDHIPYVHSQWENAGSKASTSAIVLENQLAAFVDRFSRAEALESAKKWSEACDELIGQLSVAEYAAELSDKLAKENTAVKFAEISKDTNDITTLTRARRAATCQRAGIDPVALKASRFTANVPKSTTASLTLTSMDRQDMANISAAASAGKSAMLAGQAAGKAQDYALACKQFTTAAERLKYVEDYGALLAATLAARRKYNEPVEAFSNEAKRVLPMAEQRKAMSCQRSAPK